MSSPPLSHPTLHRASLTTHLTHSLQSYERRKDAALEVETLVRRLSESDQLGRVYLLVDALATGYAQPSAGNSNGRKGGLLCLAAVAVGLANSAAAEDPEFVRRVAPSVLTACTDADARVRYYALEALYNVAKSTRPAILAFFPEIFDILFKLCSDPDRSVFNASTILDELMKSTIAEAQGFPFETFLPRLAVAMAVDASAQRHFLLGWISLLDGLPHADAYLMQSLPSLVPGMLDFLGDRAPEVQGAAGKLLRQLMADASAEPSRVDVPALATALTEWLADASDGPARASALAWLRALVAAAPRELGPLAPALLRACLSCLDTADAESQALGAELNEELIKSEALLARADAEALLTVAAEGIGAMQETARLEALRWTATLLQRGAHSALQPAVLPALCDALSATSDRVVQEAVAVLAAASGTGEEGCRRALSSVLGCFRGVPGSKLLQRRGAAIIEGLCHSMGARRVLGALADLLSTDTDPEFSRMMAHGVALTLLTSPELEGARGLLAGAASDPAGAEFVASIFPGIAMSVAAALAVAFFAGAHGAAADMVVSLSKAPLVADIAASVVDLGQIVSLLEAPAFARLRLELLTPRRHPALLRALYSLLLVLPLGEAFRMLRERLDCIPSAAAAAALEDESAAAASSELDTRLLHWFVDAQTRRLASSNLPNTPNGT